MNRIGVVLAAILLVPIVPFVLFHASIEQRLDAIMATAPADGTVMALVVGVLATDVFLPVPSSFVSTLAGGQLTPVRATLASWLGLSLGAVLGFLAARLWGRPLAERLAGREDLVAMSRRGNTYAPAALILTRALPILAEAAVLLYGVQKLSWRVFLPPVLLANLGIAIGYSLLGYYACKYEWLPFALSISVALPLWIAWLVRRPSRRMLPMEQDRSL